MYLFDLSGKVAVVTGGTRGIGMMMARGLLQAGASVYISSRKPEAGEAAAAELSEYGTVLSVPADLAREEECQRLADGGRPFRRGHPRPGQQRRHQLGRPSGGVPRARLGQGRRPQPQDAVLPDPGVPAAARGGRHRRRPGPGDQRRQHRRAARAVRVPDLLLLGQQGRAASAHPGTGPRARAAAHHRQRGRPRPVRVQDDGGHPGRPRRRDRGLARRSAASAVPTTWPASRSS